MNAGREMFIKVRQVTYLNNVVEQDHRAIQSRTRPMRGFKDLDCVRAILSGIEVIHMIKKGQVNDFGKTPLPVAQQFNSLVSLSIHPSRSLVQYTLPRQNPTVHLLVPRRR